MPCPALPPSWRPSLGVLGRCTVCTRPTPAARRGRRGFRALLAVALIGLCASGGALAQEGGELPSPVRPGAVAPERDDIRRVPPEPAAPVLEIPPMIDRELDPDAGARIRVQRFDVTGARNRPRQGVRVEAIEALLEEARREREEEGFTVGQLERVADRVTQYYRERGLILAQAVVPVQTVEDGVVEIEVIEGRLGQVRSRGNQRYRTETLEQVFRDLLGEPVSQADTEAALLTLTDYPGLAAYGVFEPGRAVGETDLVLQVQAEPRFEGRLRVDNHGTRQTGRGRGRAQVHWNNPTGNADRLTVTGLHSFSPANSFFSSLEYSRRFGRYYQASGFVRSNRFDVAGDLGGLDISGETDQAGLELGRNWVRSRSLNLSSRARLAVKRSRTLRGGNQDNEDRLTVLEAQIEYDSVDARFGGLNFAGIELSQGLNDALGAMGDADSAAALPASERPSRRGGSAFAEGEFTKLFGYYSRLQNLARGQSLLLRSELQYSDDVLVPMEQYAIGGADNVRAFPSSHALTDSGWFVSAEYLVEPFWIEGEAFGGHNWRDVFRGTLFYDFAGGTLNDPRADQPDGAVSFHGVGIGLQFDVPGLIESRLQIAWGTGEDDEIADPDAVRSTQIWADLTYRF